MAVRKGRRPLLYAPSEFRPVSVQSSLRYRPGYCIFYSINFRLKKIRTRRRTSPFPPVDRFDPARRLLCLHTTFCFPNDMINESGDTTLLRAIDDNVFLLFGYKWLRASVCVCNGFSRSPCCQSSKLSIIAHTHTHATRLKIFSLIIFDEIRWTYTTFRCWNYKT